MLSVLVWCIGAALGVFIAAVLGTAVGALSGWFVSLTPFGDWIKHVLGGDYTIAELGAVLGFVGAFIRSTVVRKDE